MNTASNSSPAGSSSTRKVIAVAILLIAGGLLIWRYTSRATGNAADRAAEARSAELLREAAALEHSSAPAPTDTGATAPGGASASGSPTETTRQPVRAR